MEMEMTMAVTKDDTLRIEEEEEEEENDGKRFRVAVTGFDYFDPTILRQKLVEHDSKYPDDFLGANRSIKKRLFCSDGREIGIQETLRGKIIGLFFCLCSNTEVPTFVTHFYRSLKRKHGASFEMLFVPLPVVHPPLSQPFTESEYVSMFYELLRAHLPFPAVHVHDSEWGEHLSTFSRPGLSFVAGMSFIDARYPPEVTPLPDNFDEYRVSLYGPHLYPFTPDRLRVLEEEFYQFGGKTSITDILGATGTDDSFLVNRDGHHIHVSSLENKIVFLYAYYDNGCVSHPDCIEQLKDIYNKTSRDELEIVFINMQHNDGYKDRTAFDEAILSMPWLVLPFDDDRIWNLEFTMLKIGYWCRKRLCWSDLPIMFIKPAGNQSPIDPYGYPVLQEFGLESYPFTRAKAARLTMDKLKSLTWASFANKGQESGLDFNSLLRSNNGDVSLSTIFPNQGRDMLLLFAKTGFLSQGRLKSLIKAYSKARLSPTPFEVILVSLDDTKIPNPFFVEGERMPWYVVKTPLLWREHSDLFEATLGFDISENTSHFIAFGNGGDLLRVGITSLDDHEFPFLNEEEYEKHIYYCITHYYKWTRDADSSYSFEEDCLLWDTSVDLE